MRAIRFPILEATIEGAIQILLIIELGKEPDWLNIQDASEIVLQTAGYRAEILIRTSFKESLVDRVRVTLIAS